MKIALGKGPYGEDCRVAINTDLLRGGAAFTLISQTAYFIYLGWCAELVSLTFLNASQTLASATITTAEMGYFSTPAPPNRAGQTLTKLCAGAFTGTGTGLKRNTSSFATALAAPAHLWGGIRVNATTPGQFTSVSRDWSAGQYLTLAAAGAFSSTPTFAGVVPAFSDAGTIGPDLFGTSD